MPLLTILKQKLEYLTQTSALRNRVADPDPDPVGSSVFAWIRIRFSNFSGSGSGFGFSPRSGTENDENGGLDADPDPVCPERLDPDPVCPERLDPDPVNSRPDPQPCK